MPQLKLFEMQQKHEDYFFGIDQIKNYADIFGGKIFQYAQADLKDHPRVLSLFSGAGGLDIGFHDAGFNIVESVEIERVFANTLQANIGKGEYFGNTLRVTCSDIKEYCPELEHVDFIIGGPPCQSFSAAGARAEGVAGTKDDRGRLFLEYVRLLRALKPKGFLFENVYRITGANKGKDWKEIIEAFSGAGYTLFFRVLDTADFGVPQHRERLIIVGLQNNLVRSQAFLYPRPTHGPESYLGIPHYSSANAIQDIAHAPHKAGLSGKYGHLLTEIPHGLNYSFFTEKMGHPRPIFAWRSKFSDFLYKADPLKPVRTLKAQGGQYTGPFHWDSRPFSIEELKRLQTFPDAYILTGSRSQTIRQLGNSVPPQFARILALAVLEQVFRCKIPVALKYMPTNEKLHFRTRQRLLTPQYQEKASTAVKKTDCSFSGHFASESFTFNIDSRFCYTICSDGFFFANIFEENEKLFINIHNSSELRNDPIMFEVKIIPNSSWILKYKKIYMRSYIKGIHAFTALWKTFDYLLAKNNIKADIVQLRGYYQYPPAFSQKLYIYEDSFNDMQSQNILQRVCSGEVTKKTFYLSELSQLFGISEEITLHKLAMLKNIGYEVRSNNTNASISEQKYLIPYSFPTLTPLSVQLSKRL